MNQQADSQSKRQGDGSPLRALILHQAVPEQTVRILTQWKNRKLTPEQLTYAANSALADYLAEPLSTLRSTLRKALQFQPRDLYLDGAACIFPDGCLSYTFENETRDRGLLHSQLRLGNVWLQDLSRLRRLVDCLEFSADSLAFETDFALSPLDQLAVFEARGWEAVRESEEKIVMMKQNVTLEVEPDMLTFHGVALDDLLAEEAWLTIGSIGSTTDSFHREDGEEGRKL